jgi:CMP-N,N'-diacetyllegionaminic acid synthase
MIGSLKVLAIVPARGGSKRVPGKNVRVVGGKPLIAWTLDAARKSRYVDHLAVSSDDEGILELAARLGCDTSLRRPDALATDETPGTDPVLHAIGALPGFDIAVLLQPTSPLRRPTDIDACIEKCATPGVNACVSVTPSRENPEWLYRLDTRGCMIPALSRTAGLAGAAGSLYVLNGAVYAARLPWLREHRTFLTPETAGYVMPDEYSLDIDTPQDLKLADLMLSQGPNASG